jgi:hypothetical protein
MFCLSIYFKQYISEKKVLFAIRNKIILITQKLLATIKTEKVKEKIFKN